MQINIWFWLGVLFSTAILFGNRSEIHHYFTRTVSIYALSAVVIAVAVTAFLGSWCISGETEFQSVFFALETVFNLLEGASKDFRDIFYHSVCLRIWTYALSVLLPFLTASTVAILIVEHIPRPVKSADVYYIFSQLDHRTILLAEDIDCNKQDETCVCLFLRTNTEELSDSMKSRIHGIQARCFPYSEQELLRYHPRIRCKKLRFFFLSKNTDENFNQLKEFLVAVENQGLFKKNDKEEQLVENAKQAIYQQELYLLSETVSAPMLIDRLRGMLCEGEGNQRRRKEIFRWTELRLLDRYRSLSYELLQKIPLYVTKQQGKNSVLILGFGRVGEALFRTMVSFSSMVGHEITFTLCARNIQERYQTMMQLYPECGKGYSVKLLSWNVEACDLWSTIEKTDGFPYTFIAVCLGDDERNINVASQLKRFYRKWNWEHKKSEVPEDHIHPYICVNVENQIKSDYTESLFDDCKESNWNHNLVPFGTDKDRFSVRTLMPRKVWITAQEVHKMLKNEDVWSLALWSEYERRSSIACACHMSYHVASITDSKLLDYDYAAHEDELIQAEHQRWMDYVRTEGMQAVSLDTVDAYLHKLDHYVDVAGRLTPCLVPIEQLEDIYNDLRNPNRVGKDLPEFKDKDRIVVENADKFANEIKS